MATDSMLRIKRAIVLIGLMGAGKTSVGRKLAKLIDMDFVDVDEEISKAAGCSIEDIFDKYGEDAFRDVEERVMARLLNENPRVLATGGGAIMNPRTQKLIKEHGISVWLSADLDVLVRRTSKREGRPLLKNKDHGAILKKLLDERSPVYAKADIFVDSSEDGPEVTASNIKQKLSNLS
jgi:shikimate kinase